jgi:hypothetical protein
MPSPPERSPYQLRVEGRDDVHCVIHLLKQSGYDWDDPRILHPYLEGAGGIEPLLDLVGVLFAGPYARAGLVLDANSAPAARWVELRRRAARAGVELPETPDPAGTVIPGARPGSRVGIWLMPDNSSPGALEDFLGEMVPPDDPCWSYAGEAAVEARNRGARCPEKHHKKSQLHTWLAWQEDPGNPFGTAIRSQAFRIDGDLAGRFVTWFRRLFVDP